MSENLLYQVLDAKQYLTSERNDIRKINQKSSSYTFTTEQNQFKVKLKMSSPALLTMLEFKVEQADHLNFDFYRKGAQASQSKFLKISTEHKKKGQGKPQIIKFDKQPILIDQIHFTILNEPIPRKSIIHYLITKGIKDDINEKKKPTIKNISQKDIIDVDARAKKQSDNKKKDRFDFNQREQKKTSPADLIKEVQQGVQQKKLPKSQHKIKKQALDVDEDSQLRKILELSKKQQKIQDILYNPQKKMQDQYFYQKNYETIELNDQLKKVYEHINIKWLNAQREAEKKIGIREQNSILTYIKPKCFHSLKFCINSIIYDDKRQLVKMINDMGGRVLENPENNLYIVSSQMSGDMITQAKKFTNIKFVTPNFVHDCYFKGYCLEVSQYKTKH